MRDEIIRIAKEYINTPYLHQGRLKNKGIDCAGLIVEVAKEAGIYSEGDYTNYSRIPDGETLAKTLNTYCDKINFNEIKDGDIILFKFVKNPQHLAIYYKYNDMDYIIHSYSVAGKVIMQRLDSKWKNRIAAVYKYKEIK